jgi:hypothetical protein
MPLIRYPGSVRARLCVILILAVGLLLADGVRRYVAWMGESMRRELQRP